MRFNDLRWLPLLRISIAALGFAAGFAGPGAAADKGTFQAKAVTEYPHRQTSEKVTIAAEPFITDEQAKEAFGKTNPWRFGVLPILVVIRNDSPHALKVDGIKFVYELPDRTRAEATPASDVKFLGGVRQAKSYPTPIGIKIGKGSKGPLSEWEIEGRAFAAKVIPAGESASGFVYFQASTESAAASLFISGLVDAVSRNELYYFEIPLSGK